MSYRYWRKLHPEWPRRLRDLVGSKVRLRRDLETRGGEKFKAGTVMLVTSPYRGRLTLDEAADHKRWIRRVDLRDVELLPADQRADTLA